MSQWQKHITQLKELLTQLNKELTPYLHADQQKQKQAQLLSVEKSIVQLEKSNTPIPDELRKLKFKLLKELDAFKEAVAVQTELQQLFAPFISKAKQSPQKAKQHKVRHPKPVSIKSTRTTLQQLIDAGLVPKNTVLVRSHKGKWLRAAITDDGQIEIQINGSKQLFDSPSSAAVAATGTSINGWDWWFIDGLPGKIKLDHFRKLYNQKL